MCYLQVKRKMYKVLKKMTLFRLWRRWENAGKIAVSFFSSNHWTCTSCTGTLNQVLKGYWTYRDQNTKCTVVDQLTFFCHWSHRHRFLTSDGLHNLRPWHSTRNLTMPSRCLESVSPPSSWNSAVTQKTEKRKYTQMWFFLSHIENCIDNCIRMYTYIWTVKFFIRKYNYQYVAETYTN